MKIEAVLKKLNLEHPWQLLLHLPVSYDDYRNVVYDFNPHLLPEGCEATYIGRSAFSNLKTVFKNGKPRTIVTLTDGNNTVGFTLFGDQRALEGALAKQPNMQLCVHGVVNRFNGKLYLNNAKLISSEQAGTVVSVYPGVKGKVGAVSLRIAIEEACTSSNTRLAAEYIEQRLRNAVSPEKADKLLASERVGLADAIYEIHTPTDESTVEQAFRLLRRVGVAVVAGETTQKCNNRQVEPILGPDWQSLARAIPFNLTDEQQEAIRFAVSKMAAGQKFNGLLIGDVGTGKTAVFSVIAAYVAYAGRRVAIMLPNETLARQVFAEFTSYYPELATLLCVGQSKGQSVGNANVLIGTTALLFRGVGYVDLCVVDEEHKMGVEQREVLAGDTTHTLNVSATPIPRSYALAKFGAVDILTLKKAHLEKNISTQIVTADMGDWLMGEVIATLNQKAKVLVVCPMREDKNNDSDMYSVERIAFALEQQFPGRVRMVHSERSSEDNAQALQDIKEGPADILVATVAVEVGVTIPELRHLVVYGADRFGLVTLHQLRGRLARTPPRYSQDNWGKCHLFLVKDKIAEQTQERLNILVNHSDGFEIAQQDLELRGCGDINISEGARQHGATSVFIQNMTIRIEELARAVEWLNR